MESNLSAYYKEEEGFDCIENDHGFCSYRLDVMNKTCYIGHVFVKEESRKKGHGSKFLDEIETICKDNGMKSIVGDLYINVYNCKGYTRKLMVMLVCGFHIIDVNDKCVTIMKEM